MNLSRYNCSLAVLLISFSLFAWGCTKIDTTTIGRDLIPSVDNIHTFDTVLNVIANNHDAADECDSVVRTDLHALGIIENDPLFGKTSANIYVEFKPASYPVKIPEHDENTMVIDSVVMVLQYSHTFGDTNVVQKAQVYPLINNFKVDSNYTTCNKLEYSNALLGEKVYTPVSLKDSVNGFNEKAKNQLRIPINKELVSGWIESASTVLSSDSAFKVVQKGFAIIADEATGGEAINYFDLTSANSRLAIYLRYQRNDTIKDTVAINFPFTNYSGEANSITRNRGNSEITRHLEQPAKGDEMVYIQTSPGSFATISIPGLGDLSNRVIHRAELIMEQDYSDAQADDVFMAPHMLFLDYKDTSGRYLPLPCDFSAETMQNNFSILGGMAKKVKDDNGNSYSKYVFNISRYVQNLVTEKSSNEVLRLRAPYYIQNTKTYVDRCGNVINPFTYGLNFIAAGRVKLNGTNDSPKRMRVRIIYSKL